MGLIKSVASLDYKTIKIIDSNKVFNRFYKNDFVINSTLFPILKYFKNEVD